MKIIKLLALFCLAGKVVCAQIPELCRNLQHPESVITDGKFIYVADIGKTMEPMAKDGDGAMRKFSLTGKLISSNIAKTVLNAPKGMTIIGNVLYCADVDRIVGISLTSGRLMREISFAPYKTLLINDLVKVNDSTIYATATDINRVFKVTIGHNVHIKEVNMPPLIGANGICYDKKSNRIFVVGLGKFTDKAPTGKIGCIKLNNGAESYVEIPTPPGFYDGVVVENDSTIIVTDWRSLQKPAGELFRINVKTGQSIKLKLPRTISGPADIWFDKTKRRLLIPEMLPGKILTYRL